LGSSARGSPKLPRDREIHLICRSGQRTYIATRMLQQNGFNAKTVSGGMLSLANNYLLGQGDYG
jgi:rhodanese-related sulfurtransferase